jgi:membrane-bound lytic murein transglycosylase D
MQDTSGALRAFWRTALLGAVVLSAGCAGMAPVSDSTGTAAGSPIAPSSSTSTTAAPPVAAPAAPAPAPLVQRPATPSTDAPPDSAALPAAPPASLALAAPLPEHRDLWARMRAGFAMPDLDTPLVQEKERFYTARPEALQRMFARGEPYLYFIIDEVEKRGMPTEIALLPFVESAMNPVALSHAKAAGLWQFIPSTGKQYELSQNWWVDNRRDVVQSTRAALDYLQKIYEMHGNDWFLALASYNWGENAVARAVRNNQARGRPTDYLSLSMPAETRHYVPKLIALKHIVMRADEFGIALPALPNRPYFATIEKTRPIDLKLAAQFAGMSVDEFVALNPAHNRPVIAASRNNQIKLPADRVQAFMKALDRHDRGSLPLASWQPYTLKPGETLEQVARRGNVSTAELLRANGLSAGRRLLPGTQLIAPQASVDDELQVERFEGPKLYEQVFAPAVYHRVKKDESLAGLAASYGVTQAQLRSWNGGVKSPRPGSTLLVRPAGSQTVLTKADGSRQVIARAAPAPVAEAEEAGSPIRTVSATARPAAAVPNEARSAARAPAPKAGTGTGTKAKTNTKTKAGASPSKTGAEPSAGKRPPAAAGAPTSIKTVYKPPRTTQRGMSTKNAPRPPRT